MEVPLRKWQFDAVIAKQLEKSEVDIGLQNQRRMGLTGCPDPQYEIDRVIPVVGKNDVR